MPDPNTELKETPTRFMQRREVELRQEEQEEQAEERRKNQDFAMIYDRRGSATLRLVASKSGQAIAMFFWIVEQMDRRGSVVVSNETLAEALGMQATNVSRALGVLRDHGIVMLLTSGIRVICVNPEIAWRSTADGKQYALFDARVVVPRLEMETAQAEASRLYQAAQERAQDEIRRVRAIVKKPTKQRDLPPPVGPEPAVEARLEPAGKVDVKKGPGLKIKRPAKK